MSSNSKSDDLSTLLKFYEVLRSLTVEDGLRVFCETAKQTLLERDITESEKKKIIFKWLLPVHKDRTMNTILKRTTNKLIKSGHQLNEQNNSNNNNRKNSILALPNDLLCKSFQYLFGIQLDNQRMVCRRFLYESRKPQSFSGRLMLEIKNLSLEEHSTKLVSTLEKYSTNYSNVKELWLIFPDKFASNKGDIINYLTGKVSTQKIRNFGILFPNVERVYLHSYSSMVIINSSAVHLYKFNKLKMISLVNVKFDDWTPYYGHTPELIIHTPVLTTFKRNLNGFNKLNIKCLRIGDYPVTGKVQCMERLEGLAIRDAFVLDGLGFQLLNAPNLKYLVLDGMTKFENAVDMMGPVNLGKLMEIYINLKTYPNQFCLVSKFKCKPKIVVISHSIPENSPKLRGIKTFFDNNSKLLNNLNMFKLDLTVNNKDELSDVYKLMFSTFRNGKGFPKKMILIFKAYIKKNLLFEVYKSYCKILEHISNHKNIYRNFGCDEILTLFDSKKYTNTNSIVLHVTYKESCVAFRRNILSKKFNYFSFQRDIISLLEISDQDSKISGQKREEIQRRFFYSDYDKLNEIKEHINYK